MGQIVNNGSQDVMRMLDTAFNDFLPEGSKEQRRDFYPAELRCDIDEINPWLMSDFDFGVYEAGFEFFQA